VWHKEKKTLNYKKVCKMNKKIGIKQEERGIPFEFIKENVQTIGELRELSEKIGFYKKEQLTKNYF